MAFDNFLQLPAEADTLSLLALMKTISKLLGTSKPRFGKMLRILQSYKPRAIGLDMFRDLTADPGYAELAKILQTPNLVAIEMALSLEATLNVKPPQSCHPRGLCRCNY